MLKACLILFLCPFGALIYLYGEGQSASSVPFYAIPQARVEFKKESTRLGEMLAQLPDFKESRQLNSYGYHAGYLPRLEAIPERARWIVDVSFTAKASLEDIILVPAVDPRFSDLRAYGFPQRYRISIILHDGSVSVVEDWSKKNAPDLGYLPRRVSIDSKGISKFRLEVFQGAVEGDKEFFAMGEVFGVVRNGIWKPREITVSSSFESVPYWSKRYLKDQKTGLGMPLGRFDADLPPDVVQDFNIEFDTEAEGACIIGLDMGKNVSFGWVSLFPAKPADDGVFPGYGFPSRIDVFVSNKFTHRVAERGPFSEMKTFKGNPADNAVHIPFNAQKGRWLILKCSGFAKDIDRDFLALGEIAVQRKGEFLTPHAVHLSGFPESAETIAAQLIDGMVGGCQILIFSKWLEIIEQQYLLNVRLQESVAAEAALGLRWDLLQRRFWIALAALALLALVASFIYRRFAVQRLQLRLAEEHHLAEVEQLKLRFFTHISHELRTPLTVISAPIVRAIREVESPKLKNYLGMALRNVHEMQQLVEQILELRRIHDGKMRIEPEAVEATQLLGEMVEGYQSMATEKGIALLFEPSGAPCSAFLDPRVLKRILGNLISNALKYTPAGGRVWVGLCMDAEELLVTIEDTGPGIPAADQHHIFEQHYRSDSAVTSEVYGSGIGLALVQELTERIGGHVSIESPIANGLGSRFTFRVSVHAKVNDDGK